MVIVGVCTFFAALFGSAWAAGYYLAWPPILLITVLLVALMVFFVRKKLQGEEGLITMNVIWCGTLWSIVAWVTFYVSSEQRWVQDFFNNVILR